MKDVWVVETALTNGVMVVGNTFDVFSDEKMALEAVEVIKEKNKDSGLPVRVNIKKSKLIEPGDKAL
jgi:hypothetical protein